MNPSVDYIKASDGSGNASLMTITQVRTAPATTITVNTVSGAPTKFFATMGTPHTFNDPVTGETITIISEATAVDFAGHISSGKVEIDAIAPGQTDLGSKVGDIIIIRPTTQWADNISDVLSESHNDDGTLKDNIVTAAKTSFGGNYSTSEVNTGFTWIDGKTIYKKTIDCGSLPNNTFKVTNTGIVGMTRLIKFEAIAVSGTSIHPIPLTTNTAAGQTQITFDMTSIIIGTASDRTSFNGIVTLYYTKA